MTCKFTPQVRVSVFTFTITRYLLVLLHQLVELHDLSTIFTLNLHQLTNFQGLLIFATADYIRVKVSVRLHESDIRVKNRKKVQNTLTFTRTFKITRSFHYIYPKFTFVSMIVDTSTCATCVTQTENYTFFYTNPIITRTLHDKYLYFTIVSMRLKLKYKKCFRKHNNFSLNLSILSCLIGFKSYSAYKSSTRNAANTVEL